jgi:hypothetical protein
MESDVNPMYLRRVSEMQAAVRCSARSKRTGLPCKGPAVTGWAVCRFHGARGGAPNGPANGAYRHGNKTKQAQANRKAVRELLAEVAALLKALPKS